MAGPEKYCIFSRISIGEEFIHSKMRMMRVEDCVVNGVTKNALCMQGESIGRHFRVEDFSYVIKQPTINVLTFRKPEDILAQREQKRAQQLK